MSAREDLISKNADKELGGFYLSRGRGMEENWHASHQWCQIMVTNIQVMNLKNIDDKESLSSAGGVGPH